MQLRHDPDALAALIALQPTHASRNRHFALFATREARDARRRAFLIRGVVRELSGAHGPVRILSCDFEGEIVSIHYALARLSATRVVRLSATDFAVARVALARRGVRLLPAALVARDEDHATVARLVGHGEAALASTRANVEAASSEARPQNAH